MILSRVLKETEEVFKSLTILVHTEHQSLQPMADSPEINSSLIISDRSSDIKFFQSIRHFTDNVRQSQHNSNPPSKATLRTTVSLMDFSSRVFATETCQEIPMVSELYVSLCFLCSHYSHSFTVFILPQSFKFYVSPRKLFARGLHSKQL